MQPMVEKRGTSRSRLLKGGVIAFSGRHATLPCVVRDISDSGARLQVAQGSTVPDTFELLVELDGLEVACRTAWRKATEVGIAFLETPRFGNPRRSQVVGTTGARLRASLRRPSTVPAPAVEPTAERSATVDTPIAEPHVHPERLSGRPTANGRGHGMPVLIAEDDPDDRLLMRDAFAECGFRHPVTFVRDGVELLEYVRGEGSFRDREYPALILLDLNMPRMDGRTALMHLKTDPRHKRVPVIVLTTSHAEDDIHRTYELGVTAYVSKPSSQNGLNELVSSLNGFWGRFVSLPAP